MKEKEYFAQIENSIKSLEVNKKVRKYKDNSDTLITYWTVGKLLIEAQGGEERAKYGNELVKKWSKILIEKYGKGYNYSSLQKFKKFYIEFPNVAALRPQFISWTHIRQLLPIKDIDKINYYIKIYLEKDLNKRQPGETIQNRECKSLTDEDSTLNYIDDFLKEIGTGFNY